MTEYKKLGKISKASFGMGGYHECMVGLTLVFETGGTVVSTFEGMWGIERTEHAQWTESDRLIEIGRAGLKLAQMLRKIKRHDVSNLVGTPVEVTYEGNVLKSWRLLDEVL